MAVPPSASVRRDPAISLLRELRRLDEASGVKHSGIARDIGLLLYERGSGGLSVNELCDRTGYSGPTIRLVLQRLMEAGTVAAGERHLKTQLYRLTARGTTAFDAYVAAVWAFVEARAGDLRTITVAASPAPDRGPPSGPPPPPGRYEAAPPGPGAAG